MHRSLRIGSGPLDGNSLSALRSGPYEGKIAGLYDLEETLGRGHFAVVKLARHVFTGEKVAVKVIDKSKLDEVSKAHLFQEVRCMKLVQHPNVVRLYEVIDTATKLYLILELGDGGDLYDYIMRHDTGLSEQLAKEYFRQIVRAISYCHQLHVVHRDLKPENVVFFEKLGVVKLTDFGFSNKFCPGQKLETSCGSLAYSAPEILLGDSYDAPAVDIWSLGVILYMLVCGQAPFQEANDSETLTMIMDCKYSVPPHVSKDCQDLIARMLVRNPEKRATLAEIAGHKWLKVDKQDNPPIDTLPLVSREQLSEEDHNVIVQKIVNGNIATKEEIQECLDKNEYNHITATYYLLAERKLRAKRQDQANKNKRPEHLAVPHNSPAPKRDNNGTGPTPCLLSVPRTPGDVPQRSRKCSIVQEDEEEEDISSCSGREELVPPLNRRGSRSEGRLNLALQERLADRTPQTHHRQTRSH
ncbi:SNF-related serine/threonine-protein kinase-like Protein [Tribolium castaneum]|uniref:SNF-related serine/threonine-protein kinase n=1 Tax=Tribolium castaneum TaxID=7070 RepID=D6WGN7_TRICA|nr:SNF-related serine/threonine-protein kinase-like Protein [Tribolium castaneum]